jgi:integration host factor subunit alpha
MALTKSQIADAITEPNGFTRKKSAKTIETVLELIKSAFESGEDVLISGFSKFCVKDTQKRKGRNPATGEDMMVVPGRVAAFRRSGN